MYAVIHTGGKQYRVEPGQRLEVERLCAEPEAVVDLRPVLLVDGDTVLAGPEQLKAATVKAKVVGEIAQQDHPFIHNFFQGERGRRAVEAAAARDKDRNARLAPPAQREGV